ncbi:YbaL family putative K(+) efflux transporter [Ramlibacter sp. Leaf400]|uniref:YbaL family putative K(+) efflux transporter n=1 Tax=Ramlibacter sp. Leaf400 TaxID=1736365 RepID=UPI0009EAE9F6|nr:YbaL family putative K(+) efflux transporter [Ramlibacter sp. Leaf400]
MPHHAPLIATLVGSLCLAFVLGALAHRLRLPPLAGYLLAGVALGPHTPGFVADQALANELAEIGVILLMFGVGLHFSLKDLLAVRRVAVPGALVQIAVATALGWALGRSFGWSDPASLVFGLSLSVASTVVLLRALQQQRLLDTDRGHIAIGWLIVEDLVMVIALVLLPVLAESVQGGDVSALDLVLELGWTLVKVAAFVAVMLVVGRRLLPWVMDRIARGGSKELFRLAVLAIALGVAFGSAWMFDVSFALGAFFAGMVLGESELSTEAADETVPLRDAFAVLFFVSIGMLLDPAILVEQPWAVLATFLIIVLGKSLAAFLIVRLFRHPSATALTISASLAQIGEFSFILAGLGVSLQLLPEEGRDLILAGAILSILCNPLIFVALTRLSDRTDNRAARRRRREETARADNALSHLKGHTVLIGHGRVGERVAAMLVEQGAPLVVIEDRLDRVRELREQGLEVLCGSGVNIALLEDANVAQAAQLVVTTADPYEAGEVIRRARRLNPGIAVTARAHTGGAVEYLDSRGADHVIMGEHEIARGMADWVLFRYRGNGDGPGPARSARRPTAPAEAR